MSAADVVEGVTGTTDLIRPVPVAAKADRAAFSTAEGDVTVNVPASADGEVEAVAANGEAVRIGLAGARPVPGVRSDAGTVAYADVKDSTDLAVQPAADGGVRTLVTLKDASAPSEYRFPLELGKDSALAEDGSGGYLITRGAGDHKLVVGTIDAPWATDAAGRPVPTDYRLEGATLVQTVTPSSETAFPVVADPKLTYGAGIYFNATGTEWKSYAIAAGSVGYFANVVGCGFTDKIPHAALKRAAQLICSVIGYKTLKDYGAFLKKVVKDKKLSPGSCYQTRLTPKNGKLTKVSAGNCK
ncbi:hypothetical protein [Streptomyces sp. MBT55]|uniref:hypothetical protein n=1 Tax=Streptomyces sp. MBT55 TaxID=1488386 RepID=UPI00191145DE|nr:hypothetical protein [Streptomyces sp. MBT55]MBK6041193.1 hypothetical protein [Streptomyces sp. MBT55]